MEIRIKEHKNILNKTFQIINNRLILVGKNSIGKSNILEAIAEDSFELVGSKNEFKDVLYIKSESNMNEEFTLNEKSAFVKLYKKLYDSDNGVDCDDIVDYVNKSLCNDKEYLVNNLVNDIKLDVHSDDFASAFTRDGTNVDLSVGSGFKRRLLFKMLTKLGETDLDENFIILVDSPELHAHPAMIRTFCKELRDLSTKGHIVIVVTHNSDVVGGLYQDIREIAKLSIERGVLEVNQINLHDYAKKVRDFYNTKDIYRLPNGKSNVALSHIVKNDIEAFCKTLLRDKALKVLFADYILIGEGASEDILFDYIFRHVDSLMLNNLNIDYFTSFGKFYMPFYFILANMYEVDVVCLFDVDDLENRSHKAFYDAFLKYEQNNKGKFVTVTLNPDLERVIGLELPNHRVEKPLHIYNAMTENNVKIDELVKRIEKGLSLLH